MVLIGMTGFAVVLTTVGLIQGNAWYNGETLYRTLPEIQPYYILRA
jgi:cytochrome c oxidase cbb3-type subunit 1/cytochrome c oxidase cbb3-type subunit I/II